MSSETNLAVYTDSLCGAHSYNQCHQYMYNLLWLTAV